jgi:ribosome-associated heat shock protein Hsp15
MPDKPPLDRLRLDKWLWAARLFKTRAAAAEAAQLGRVEVNGLVAKPGRELKPGDRLSLRDGGLRREFEVRGLSAIRGPAPVAQALYAETVESVAAREAAAARRRQGVEPAQTLAHGRPTKRDRRQLADWTRWSASADDPGAGPR